MNNFKFLTYKPVIWKPLIYESMVMAIIKNQYRNNFQIIGSRHTFWDNDFNFLLRITNIEQFATYRKIYYNISNITQPDEMNYDFIITNHSYNEFIDA